MGILIFITIVILCAVLYRLGGIGNPFKSWMRDWLIPVILYVYFLFFNHHNWWFILPAIVLTGGALTTYWDNVFGYDNFYFHGWMIGLGAFPLFWMDVHWWLILIRAILLTLMGLLNWWVIKKQIKYADWVEELSRGAWIALTMPLLLI